eukprot:168314-Rhodomonas_salina.1
MLQPVGVVRRHPPSTARLAPRVGVDRCEVEGNLLDRDSDAGLRSDSPRPLSFWWRGLSEVLRQPLHFLRVADGCALRPSPRLRPRIQRDLLRLVAIGNTQRGGPGLDWADAYRKRTRG